LSTPWSERRSSERFAQLVDAPDAGPRHQQRSRRDTELAELAELARQLTVAPKPEPDPEFRSSLRAFLVASAQRAQVQRTEVPDGALAAKTQIVGQVRPSAGAGRARLALLGGATIGALVLSGVSMASTDSVPGDAFYQLKRSTEQMQLAFAGSDVRRGQLYIEFAGGRLQEAARVAPDRLPGLLVEMDSETRAAVKLLTSAAAAGDSAALTAISSFVDRQRDELIALQNDRDAATAVAPSLGLLDEIEARVNALSLVLTRPCPDPDLDQLGVKPETC
jgi:hypothetical protein